MIISTFFPNIPIMFVGSFMWNLILILSIVCTSIVVILLFIFSKKIKEYKHEPILEEYYIPGNLNDFAIHLRNTPINYGNDIPIKKYVESLFFDKIQQKCSLSIDEVNKLYAKDKNILEKYVKDKELLDWILNRPKFVYKKGFFKRNEVKKEQYIKEIKKMIEKMEMWGE